MSDRIEHYVMGAESTTVVNAPPTSVATGLDAREEIERLMARIEALTVAGDMLRGRILSVGECHDGCSACDANRAVVAAWKKAKDNE